MEADSQDEMHTPQGPALRGPIGLHLKLKNAESRSNHSSPEPKSGNKGFEMFGGINTTCFAGVNLRTGAAKFFDDDIKVRQQPII